MKKKILVFCDFYLPGYKSGGGMWTIVNLVDRFSKDYDFFIVTRNYESKGDTTPYTSVRSSEWNSVRGAQVYYLSKDDHSPASFIRIFDYVSPDAVFLNSAFSMPVVRFLTIRRKRLIPAIPVILAPCGEFSAGALSIKPFKKKLFLAYAKTFGLYNGITWKASFEQERDEIKLLMGNDVDVMLAPDLAPSSILPDFKVDDKPFKSEDSVKFVFLSRITRKKNLHYLLETLTKFNFGEIELDIFGPIEDRAYWDECLRLIGQCPPNIKINAEADHIPYEKGLKRMLDSHFFVLPTLGENFGYVFLEAMAAGSPLLVSDRTVWNELEERGAGFEIPLDDSDKWIAVIKRCLAMCNDEYRESSLCARKYALDWLNNSSVQDATARILEQALLKKVLV